MKRPVITAISTIVALLLIAGCGLVSSSDENIIEIELESQSLTDQNPVVAKIINLSSGEVLVYGETLRTNVQRRDDSGSWVRLIAWPVVEGEPIPFSDWFTVLSAGSEYEASFSYEQIENLIEIRNSNAGESVETISVTGEYRLIFELVFEEDYENMEAFYSQSFMVE